MTDSDFEKARTAKLRRLERIIIVTIVVSAITVLLACGLLKFFLDRFNFSPG